MREAGRRNNLTLRTSLEMINTVTIYRESNNEDIPNCLGVNVPTFYCIIHAGVFTSVERVARQSLVLGVPNYGTRSAPQFVPSIGHACK